MKKIEIFLYFIGIIILSWVAWLSYERVNFYSENPNFFSLIFFFCMVGILVIIIILITNFFWPEKNLEEKKVDDPDINHLKKVQELYNEFISKNS
ncbi:hypothetical protein IT400_04365 [Candidatus Nomurabacteria bacterium]|nr:hypothetical protein [Candidatus Nomurabacteria bacterium]